MESGRVVLVVGGRVRRGVWSAAPVGSVCDGCGQVGVSVLTNTKGGVTLVCEECRLLGGEPQPPVVGGLACVSVAAVRSAVASGVWRGDSLAAFAAAEQFERGHARWVRQTRAHGFRRVVAKDKPSRSLWAPYLG